MRPQVNIQFETETCDSADIPKSENFDRWAAAVIDGSNEVGVRIVDNEVGRQFNRRFRRIDQATNVLSFPFTTKISAEQNYLGDVLMTAPIIVQEAHDQNKPLLSHWAHLFVHALLHLQGYRHDNDFDARTMEARESKIMMALGFSDPWLCD